ncbi:MAG: recombinase family protein [Bacteriovoracaceae bacterium]|nr:recombinase family protein [Bacteriovoracaceae bacterium]
MKKGNDKIKVAGYIRVSTPGQAKEGESLEGQIEEIKSYAKYKKYKLYKIYKDEGVSGANDDRPGLNELRKDAKNEKFKIVVFKKLSRFGRNARDLLNLYNEFEEGYNVGLVSLDDNIDTTTPNGKLMRTVLAGMAEFDRELIMGQMKAGKISKLKKHEIFIGEVPYGYRFVKEARKVEVDQEQSDVYKKIVDLYLNQGLSMNDVAINLNHLNIKSPRGKTWSNTGLNYILKNPVYYQGYLVVNKHQYKTNSSGSNRIYEKDENGKRVSALKDENEWIKFPFPEITNEEEWDNIQKVIESNKRKPKNIKYPDKFLAQGYIYCGECQEKGKRESKVGISHGNKRKDGTMPAYYRCSWAFGGKKSRQARNKKKCNLRPIKMDEVDEFVWHRMMGVLTRPEEILREFIGNKKENKKKLLEQQKRVLTEIKKNNNSMKKCMDELINFSESKNKNENSQSLLRAEIEKFDLKLEEFKKTKENIAKEIGVFEVDEKSIEDLDFSKYREKLQQCLYSLAGEEKKHILGILLNIDGKIILVNQRERDLDGEEFGEMYVDCSIEWRLTPQKVYGAINYLKNKGLIKIKLKQKSSNHNARINTGRGD